MAKRLTALAVIAASCLALSACTGSAPEKTPEPASPGVSPNGTGSATSAAPSIPAYATTADEQGQKAFATFWVDTLNKATKTGDTAAMKSLAASSCVVCADFAKTLDEIYGAGGHVVSKGWQIQSMLPLANQPDNEPGLELGMLESPQTVYRSKGAKPKSYPGGQQNFRFIMIRRGDYWLVQRLDL